MRFSAVCLQALERSARVSASRRAQSISFLGLGRMGSEMAFNLFAQQRQRAASGSDAENNNNVSSSGTSKNDTNNVDAGSGMSFVVCDAVPDAAVAFANNFRTQFPAADVRIVSSPEEYVRAFILFLLLPFLSYPFLSLPSFPPSL